jgi:hypothetical protein
MMRLRSVVARNFALLIVSGREATQMNTPWLLNLVDCPGLVAQFQGSEKRSRP